MPDAEIGHVWMRELSVRRRSAAGSKHVALRNDAFRAYADDMKVPAFLAGVTALDVRKKRADGWNWQRVGVVALSSASAGRPAHTGARRQRWPPHAQRPSRHMPATGGRELVRG